MSFFDRKQDVMDVQLTPYGKILYGTGKLNPTYYAFYDDDIIYDGNYIKAEEKEEIGKEAHSRITGSVRPHTQYTFTAAENSDKGHFSPRHGIHIFDLSISTTEREYALPLAMGSADPGNENAPAWSVRYLKGELSHVSSSASSSVNMHLPIPQLYTKEADYIIGTGKSADLLEIPDGTLGIEDANVKKCEGDIDILSQFGILAFGDGTEIKIQENSIILEIQEANTSYGKENFDIELFEVEIPDPHRDAKGTINKNKKRGLMGLDREILKPLYFTKKVNPIQNDILLDEEDLPQYDVDVDPSHVEYYFNILVDGEIDRTLLCSLLPSDTAEGLESRRAINCPDMESMLGGPVEGLYDIPEDEMGEC